MNRHSRSLAALAGAGALTLSLSSCAGGSDDSAADNGDIRIVASTSTWGDLAQQVVDDAEDAGVDAAIAAAATVLAALHEGLRANVEMVEADSAEDITLRFASGREVHWGSADRAEEKAVATELVLTREGQRWNVSNPSVPSVR